MLAKQTREDVWSSHHAAEHWPVIVAPVGSLEQSRRNATSKPDPAVDVVRAAEGTTLSHRAAAG